MRNKILFAGLSASLFVIFIIPIRDTDFGWHYQCGKLIIESGKLCSINEFTTLLPSYHWYSPAHGYQIFIYLVYSYFGFAGLALSYALLSALIFTVFLAFLPGDKLFNFFALLLTLSFSWSIFSLGLRSQILSVYFFIIFLILIEASKKKLIYLLTAPPLLIVWANSHPGFFLGGIILLLLATGAVVRYLQNKISARVFIQILSISVISLAATLINPYGLGIYREVFRHTEVPLKNLIAEWVPPQPQQTMAIIIVSSIVFSLLIWKKSTDVLRFGLLILTTIFALQARRNLPLFYLSTLYALTDEHVIYPLNNVLKKIFLPEFKILIIVVAALVVIQSKKGMMLFGEPYYCLNALVTLPCKAITFMKTQKPGNIFNTYEWGGFLIWKLPEFKIFVDGRMPSWDTSKEEGLPPAWRGKSPYTIYIETLQMQKGWDEIIRNYNTDYIMIQSNTFLDLGLKNNPHRYGFEKIFDDGAAAIYRTLDKT